MSMEIEIMTFGLPKHHDFFFEVLKLQLVFKGQDSLLIHIIHSMGRLDFDDS